MPNLDPHSSGRNSKVFKLFFLTSINPVTDPNLGISDKPLPYKLTSPSM